MFEAPERSRDVSTTAIASPVGRRVPQPPEGTLPPAAGFPYVHDRGALSLPADQHESRRCSGNRRRCSRSRSRPIAPTDSPRHSTRAPSTFSIRTSDARNPPGASSMPPYKSARWRDCVPTSRREHGTSARVHGASYPNSTVRCA
jgi:hypothetical protein